jgi:hypothetical protein
VKRPMSRKAKAPYGYRRIWRLPYPPQVGTKNSLHRLAKRMYGRGPKLKSLTPDPARTQGFAPLTLGAWSDSAGANWDLYPATILISVIDEPFERTRKLEFAPGFGCTRGSFSSRRGVNFIISALVTRGDRSLHRKQRLDLAAALRDAAALLERED